MESTVINSLKRLFPKEGRALLAVSGGVDSMCMAAAALQAGLPFAVAHCNFHLRGEESDADEALVRAWCEANCVECFVKHFDTAGYAAEHGVSIEMAARELRYSWFAGLCAGEPGFCAVFVAHNANDNAETLILNLLRGTGIKGVCGMAERSEQVIDGVPLTVVRPLLGVSRAQIIDFVTAGNVPFREDRTNADVTYKRNRIRHQILPVMEEINPDMENFREVSAMADSYYQDFLGEVSPADGAVRVPLSALRARKHCKYLLFRLMEPYGFTRSDISDMAALLDAPVSGKQFRSGDTVAYFTSSELVIALAQEAWEPVLVTGPGEYLCGGREVKVSVEPKPQNLVSTDGSVILDAASLAFPFELRLWREGDWMLPLGLGGCKRKLSDVFVTLKVPAAEKALVPLVATGDGHILAIIGFGRIDESVKADAATREVIRIK